MRKLDGMDVARFARDAGFQGPALVEAIAIAKGESGWNADAIGDVDLQNEIWGPSVGLWQIRSLNAERHTGGIRDAARLQDPAFNARSAFAISREGTDFGPWTVYRTGAFRNHITAAENSVRALRDADEPLTPQHPDVVGMATNRKGDGYWQVQSDGAVFAFGKAGYFGGANNLGTLARGIIGIIPTPSEKGYWLYASDGGVFSYGDAPFLGSVSALRAAE